MSDLRTGDTINRLNAELADARSLITYRTRELNRLRALLRRLEWVGTFGYAGSEYCIVCENDKTQGHAAQCEIMKALEGRDG